MSDALGTATEMRAMKNYAGHRLSPWLGHLMVSRQETPRPLLTPGEVMQLPPTDEIVMVAGTPPIRAQKARYFKDAQLQARVLPPATPHKTDASAKDDWSRIVPLKSPEIDKPEKLSVEDATTDDPNEQRRQPELDRTQEAEKAKPIENEFEPDLKKPPKDQTVQLRQLDQQARQLARQASMDPNDGIDM